MAITRDMTNIDAECMALDPISESVSAGALFHCGKWVAFKARSKGLGQVPLAEQRGVDDRKIRGLLSNP